MNSSDPSSLHNATIASARHVGFEPVPNCGRGTTDLLWQCLSTIFLCVHTVPQFNFYKESTSTAQKFTARLQYFVTTLFIPELIAFMALAQLITARSVRKIAGERGLEISMVQAFL